MLGLERRKDRVVVHLRTGLPARLYRFIQHVAYEPDFEWGIRVMADDQNRPLVGM